MNTVRLIGDVHGKFESYGKTIKDCSRSIQVGDMGVGFPTEVPGVFSAPPSDLISRGDHRFIRGNHDSPSACRIHPRWIGDGTIEKNMMFIGGAYSIDQMFRTPGVSYWADEELSYETLDMLLQKYMIACPEIMITHECPELISDEMCRNVGWKKFNSPSRTRSAFQAMWLNHKPKLWVFGHWHLSWQRKLMGTQFICLNELEWVDLNLDTLEF